MTDAVKVLTDNEVAAIEARATKATPPPWDITSIEMSLEADPWMRGDNNRTDAEFMAHAREDVPALCQTVRVLRAERLEIQHVLASAVLEDPTEDDEPRYSTTELVEGVRWLLRMKETKQERVTALREQLARLQTPRMFPIQRSTPVKWELAQRAYDTYARLFGSTQSLERLAERGGFGLQEFACLFAGHYPEKGHQDCIAKADSVGQLITELQSQLAQVTQERCRMKRLLDVLRRGPKPSACWCTGGWHKPPQHSTACKAATQMYAELEDNHEPQH